MKLVVVSAWEPELLFLRELEAGRSSDFWRSDLEIAIEPVGVGLVEAAIGTVRCLTRNAPTHAIFVGTCGALAADLAMGQVVVGASACLIDAAVLSGAAEIPGPMPREVSFDRSLHDAACAAGAKSVQIANTVAVTIEGTLAAKLARHADVEHLEAYAFARACAVHGVAAAALLGVANEVGDRGRAQWREHHVVASARAARVAVQIIEAMRVRTSSKLPP
jgi:nucleoside phosphorylase